MQVMFDNFSVTLELLQSVLQTVHILFITRMHFYSSRAVFNVGKRSKYVYRRPTSDRLTTDLSFRKFQMTISPQPVILSILCLVLAWSFRGRRIELRYFRSNNSKMAAAAILEKFQMAISPQRVVRSTSCFALKFTPFILLSSV